MMNLLSHLTRLRRNRLQRNMLRYSEYAQEYNQDMKNCLRFSCKLRKNQTVFLIIVMRLEKS